MRPLDVVGVGEAMLELSADSPLGEAMTLRKSYGGDVLNTLLTLSRLGRRVGFVSRVGDDPFGTYLRAAWAAEGVDLQACPLVPGENGVYFISVLAGGEREFSYRRHGSAASELTPEDVDEGYIGRGRVLLVSGITQAVSETAQAATLAAVRMAKRRGVRVAYDPNVRPALWAARGADPALRAEAALEELLPFLDLILPSYPDDLPGASQPLEHAAKLSARGLTVGLKAGADGAYVAWSGGAAHVPASPVAQVRDSTGAGDAWNAGFIHALLADLSAVDAARYANALAAWKLGQRGAIPAALEGMPALDFS